MLLLGLITILLSVVGGQKVTVKYGGAIAFSFPCNANPRYLTQELQVPTDNETLVNSWRGTFYIGEWLNHFNVKLDIILDRNATIDVNPRVVHLIEMQPSEDPTSVAAGPPVKSFRLTTLQPPSTLSRIEFHVKGVDDQLPNVLSVAVNGVVLCDNRDRTVDTDLIQRWREGPSKDNGSSGGHSRDVCGIRSPVLVSGEEVVNGGRTGEERPGVIDWPWRITLWLKETATNEWRVVCGGTLIGRHRVLTAASCVENRSAEDVRVELPLPAERNVSVTAITVHRAFVEASLKDDLAVLQLESGAEGEPRFPICIIPELPAKGEDVAGTAAAVNRTIGVVDRAPTAELIPLQFEDPIACLEQHRETFGKYLSSRNVCAVNSQNKDKELAAILPGDGLYEQVYDGISYLWTLKGVASYVGDAPHLLFTNAAKYYAFIATTLVERK